MKKILSLILCFIIIFPCASRAADSSDDVLSRAAARCAEFVYTSVPNPCVSSVGGEWAVIALARSGAEVSQQYFDTYYENVCTYVAANNGILHSKKYTEYARVILALTAIGKDPSNVSGYDLAAPLADYEQTIWQGINGPVWALIALDSGSYEIPQIGGVEVLATKDMYIDRILECELADGGWALSASGSDADADVTAMVLTALSAHLDRVDAAAAAERGISVLSQLQNSNGGFDTAGSETSESSAQVLTAISSLGIAYDDERFVKNSKNVVDAILSFQKADGGFAHTNEEENSNLMATEQCLYALTAALRFKTGQTALFDMSDVSLSNAAAQPADEPKTVDVPEIVHPGKSFDDIQTHSARGAIEELCRRGIINGMTDNTFCPEDTMTRAQFAAIVVRALGLEPAEGMVFDDVKSDDWFCGYVNTAQRCQIVNGVSESLFNPNGTITREEAAVMTARAAALCSMNTNVDRSYARDILAGFTDYITISDWAFCLVAFCVNEGIADSSHMEYKPQEAVTRAEIAQMIYNMLGKAELL